MERVAKRKKKETCNSSLLKWEKPEENKDFFMCAIIKYRNPLCTPEKIQQSSAPLLQLFRVLHATSVSSGSNAVKLQV